jgi:thymidylate kinase
MSETFAAETKSVLSLVDKSLSRAVLMTSGEAGRDVDLICRVPELAALRRALGESGFQPRGRRLPRRAWTEQWVQFCDRAPQVVDLNPAERWGVSSGAIGRLFEDGVRVDCFEHVLRPSPHHALILLARRLGRGAGPLSDKQRRKVERSLGGDDGVWDRAAQIAGEWHCRSALQGLRRRHEGAGITGGQRLRAGLEPALLGGRRAERLRRGLRAAPVPRRPMVIGVSGLDGSGKSTQIAALRTTLAELGVAADVTWKPVGHGHALRFVRRTVKRLLGASPTGPAPVQAEAPALTWDPNPASRRLRERSPVLTSAWSAYVAITTAAAYRGAELRCRITGRALICDRHALDTDAHLVFQYGVAHRPDLAIRLSDAITPGADAAFQIDVPAEVARSRKSLQYTASDLDRLAAAYQQERARLGVPTVDGTLPAGQLARQIAQAVWSASRAG